MQIVVLSDNHGLFDFFDVPEGDILIHCGDWSNKGSIQECITFNKWLMEQPHKYKFYIPGNHEVGFEKQTLFCEQLIPAAENIHNKIVEVEGIKIYGNAYTLPFYNWAYMKTEVQLKEYYDLINEVDILVTHGPPKGILDTTLEGTSTGSQSLLDFTKRVKPQYHFFGHIHEAYGVDLYTSCKTIYCNVSVLDKNYNPHNRPLKVAI